jgi:hypothetical protein
MRFILDFQILLNPSVGIHISCCYLTKGYICNRKLLKVKFGSVFHSEPWVYLYIGCFVVYLPKILPNQLFFCILLQIIVATFSAR